MSLFRQPILALMFSLSAALVSSPMAQADETQIRSSFAEFAKAFNEGNAEKLASCWTEKATHVDRETGARTEGRSAIQADFAKVFESQPGIKLNAEVTRIKMVTADVAQVEGTATVIVRDGVPVESVFTGILTRSGEKWLFDSIEETAAPVPSSPSEALTQLEWLIGDWVEESGEGKVRTTFRWSANRAFLLRSFVIETANTGALEGTQVIGWDPSLQQIRSWTFSSDGSFGESTWSKNDKSWMLKSTQTNSDATRSSGTYILEQTDGDSFTLQLVGHEIDGAPQPSLPAVKVIRVLPAVQASPSANK